MKFSFNKAALIAVFLLAAVLAVAFVVLSLPRERKTGLEAFSCNNCNLIIISLDAVQARHLSMHGYPLNTTPSLEVFSKKSFLFENFVSASSWTVPSHMSWFTSLHPSQHKVTNKFVKFTADEKIVSNLENLSPNALTLAEVLKKYGYRRAAFTGDAGVSKAFGYGKGFEQYEDNNAFDSFDVSIPQAVEWLGKTKNEKFFLFLHGYDAHGQSVPKNGFTYKYASKGYSGGFTGSKAEQAKLREKGLAEGRLDLSEGDKMFWNAVYDEKINSVDEKIGSFLKEIEKMGLLENTVVVISSDHGTALFEHGLIDHGFDLYGELIEVPLIVYVPKADGGKRVDDLVSSVDLMPTLLGLLGIKEPAAEKQMMGRSFEKAFVGEKLAPMPVFAETDYRNFTHKRAVIMPDGWKLIKTMESGALELYNLNTDAAEKANLAAQMPQKARELEKTLLKHLADINAGKGPWPIGCLPVYGDQCLEKAQAEPNLDKNYNVVIVSIDSLRADKIGAYGSKKELTPSIDALAKESILFKHAYVPAPFTFQNFASILSGAYPSEHKVETWTSILSGEAPWLPEILQKKDYNTLAFVAPSLWPHFDFNKGFNLYTMGSMKNAEMQLPMIAEAIKDNRKKNFFIYWHVYDVHQPFGKDNNGEWTFNTDYNGFLLEKVLSWSSMLDAQRAFNSIHWGIYSGDDLTVELSQADKEFIEAAYESAIPGVDGKIGELVAELKGQGRWDSTIFILTTDHGEDLGEHGFYFHGDIYANNTHAPLIMHIPKMPPAIVEADVSMLDVFPAIAKILDFDAGEKRATLLDAVNGKKVRDFVAIERPPFDEVAIIRDNWKFILRNAKRVSEFKDVNDAHGLAFFQRIAEKYDTPQNELYDLSIDPSEQNNLAENPTYRGVFESLKNIAEGHASTNFGKSEPLQENGDGIPLIQPYP